MSNQSQQQIIQPLTEYLREINAGNFSCTPPAILSELTELKAEVETLVRRTKERVELHVNFEERCRHVVDVLTRFIMMDFSQRIDLGGHTDEIAAIGIGLNTLAEEFEQVRISEIKQIRALEEANRELEAFTYSVSHDLRAPLRAIRGYSGIILSKHADQLSEEALMLMNRTSVSANYMNQLIDDLLTLSRIDRKQLEKAEVDMTLLARSAYDEVSRTLSITGARFTVNQLPVGEADLRLIRQVYINLISNAVKFSSKNAAAEIEAGFILMKDLPVYYVRDNGVGFDMKYHDRLFEVFQRLPNSDAFEGTGIGLALVKRIVKKHNGNVWAESQAGKGATFYFTLS